MNEIPGNPPLCPRCNAPLPANAPEGLCPRCVAANLSAETEVKTGEAGPEGTQVVKPAPTPTPSVEEIGKLFPQLEILELLGRGGMGAVYKARQPRLDRTVALKILSADKKGDPQFAERFEREARTLAKLHHPNIVAIYEFGEEQGNFYLLMEFVDGLTLRQLLQTRKLLPEEALVIVPKICEALQYAHQQGIVHRDIKPENILLDKGGQVKIADFGIAKIVGQQAQTGLTEERQVIGTPHYMAPEQVERPNTVDHRADIYSLGVVLYEMLTSELPLGKFALPSRKVQVDVRLDEVVLHALEKEPDRRYQQAHQVKTDVEAISNGPAPRSEPPIGIPSPYPAQTGSDKTILPAFLLAFFFGVFGAHRFYVGKIVAGFLQLGLVAWCVLLIIGCAMDSPPGQPTLGILLAFSICASGIIATIDWILILCKVFTDGQGKKITRWVRSEPYSPNPSGGTAGRSPQGAPPTAATPSAGSTGKIIAPGVALMIAGVWKLFSAITGLIFLTGTHFGIPALENIPGFDSDFPTHWSTVASASIVGFRIVPALLILFGGYQMVQLQSYAWSLAAAIISVIACSLIGFPIGIWAIIILAQPDVRGVFAREASNPSRKAGASPWVLGSVGVVAALLAVGLLFSVVSGFSADGANTGLAGDSDDSAIAELPSDTTNGESNLLEMNTNGGAVMTSGLTNSIRQTARSGAAANFTKSFTVVPGGKLTMKVDRGDIHVSGSEGNVVTVRVTRKVTHANAASATRVIKEHQIELRQNGSDISIAAHTPSILDIHSLFGLFTRPNLEVHYELTVPRQFDAALETSGGDVDVIHLRGKMKTQTMGGSLAFDDIDGNVDGKTMGGDVHAGECKGELVAQTEGGSITIENFSGPSMRLGTMGGNVTADFAVAPTADCDLHTSGGNVTARLPASAAITLDAETMGGSVNTEIPVQTQGKHRESHLQGTVNGGGPVLKMHTMGGNVDLAKR